MPAPLPKDGRYALLAGQFADLDAAVTLGKRASSRGMRASTIPVVDRSGGHWFVVAVGDFASPDDARARRVAIQQDLGLLDELPVILLPTARL